ncbi:hypothetical protein ACFLYS_03185 [Chloroflexota bacterium]
MSRIIKVLGMAVVLTVILVVASAGSVFAADDCIPNEYGGDCVPNEYGPGPHAK